MVARPQEHSPEEIIATAADARLRVSDLSKSERRRLNALRELSKMEADDERLFKTEQQI